jgi:hypothetical protein
VSPILVRPVREQLEHDRVIRLLQAKNRRKFEAGINPGAQQNVAIGGGSSALYPDVILASPDRGRKAQVVIEVETGESVNHLEALAEWAHFAKLRIPFHLYVPSNMVDVARQLCDDNHIVVSEIWSYHGIGDDVRFTLIHQARQVPEPAPRRAVSSSAAPAAAAAKKKPRPAASRPARVEKAAALRKKVAKKPVSRPKRK